MAAVTESHDLAELNGAITGFHDPAYTYVLKLPANEPRDGFERDLQWGLCTANRTGLDNNDFWYVAPEQDDPERQMLFLLEHSEDKYYGYSLASAAYNAAVKYFRMKQSVSEPTCSIYAQSELSQGRVHIHLVLAGPGLNKYNAKAACRPLQNYFLAEVCSMLDRVRDGEHVPVERSDYYKVLFDWYAAKEKTENSENYRLVTVMTYKTRAGGEHVARVDAREYIVNYLLCKNAQYCLEANSERNTLGSDWFRGVQKTYMSTIVNGELIPLGARRRLWMELHSKIEATKQEPVFRGEVFGSLPEVRPSEWRAVEKAGGQQRLNKRETLMLDCLARCRQDNLLTFEQLVAAHPDLTIMMESSGGGGKLIEQVLHMFHIELVHKHTPLSYLQLLDSESKVQPNNKVFQLLVLQGYNPWMLGHWVCTLLNKRAGKQNTLLFYGPASTGKTNIAKAIVSAVKLYGCVNHQNKSFIFNDCSHKLIVWWEECLMHADWVEQAKCILGGTEFRIDRKHKESELLPQTPVIISSNNNIYEVVGGNTVSKVHDKPLRERVVQLNFMKRLHSTFGEISTQEVHAWLNSCLERFVPTLEGFYKQWQISSIKNLFPLNKLCSGCSQDLQLHQNTGFCTLCGGAPELEIRDRGQAEVGEYINCARNCIQLRLHRVS